MNKEPDIEKETRTLVALAGGEWDKLSDISQHGLRVFVSHYYELKSENDRPKNALHRSKQNEQEPWWHWSNQR